MVKRVKYKNVMIAFLMIVTVFGCKPDPLEFARPADLAGTIYTQLQSMGGFEYYLKAIDKTVYKEPLSKGGSWTVFVPTDEAFEQYMVDKGYSNFEEIPLQTIEDIVDYSVIIDGWNTTTLTFFKNRFYEGQSFRRRTQYQRPYKEIHSDSLQHVMNWESQKYIVDVSNGRLKTTNYFLDSYIEEEGFEQTDYDFMFEGGSFKTGDMKVFGAEVEQQNVIAENGIIYSLDKVFEPKLNLYENLSSSEYEGKYTMFKKILERFAEFRFIRNELNEETGITEPIHQLRFSTGVENDLLPFNPSDENYPSNIDATLSDAYGMLVPTNEALLNYLDGNSILGQFYNSYDEMPLGVLGKFISPFFFRDFYNICPSHFGQSFDVSLGLVDYKPEDVVDKEFCSNGFFVGVNTVYTNSSFGTVVGPLLLNPDYAIMLKAIQGLEIDTALESKGVDFSILGVKNDQFVNIADPNSATRKITILTDPQTFDPTNLDVIYMEVTGDPDNNNNRVYPVIGSSPSSSDLAYVQKTIEDIVLNQIVNGNVDFNSNGYFQTRSGEFFNASNGDLAAGGGDIQEGRSAQIVKTEVTDNGNFYEMSSAIERPLVFTYGALVDNSDAFSSFIEILEVTESLQTIIGLDSDRLISFINPTNTYTLFAPNNTAVAQAITDGVIEEPSTIAGIVDDVERAIAEKNLLDFAKRHFIQQSISTDGVTSGTFPSLFFEKIIDFAPLYVDYTVTSDSTSSISVTNIETGESATTGNITNLLSKRVIIHEVGNYIK